MRNITELYRIAVDHAVEAVGKLGKKELEELRKKLLEEVAKIASINTQEIVTHINAKLPPQ